MLLQLEIMFPDEGYDIENMIPKLKSITLSFKSDYYDDIILLNIDPHKVDYRIYKEDNHIFIVAVTDVYKNNLGFGYNYFGDLNLGLAYMRIVDIDMEIEHLSNQLFIIYDINTSISRMSFEYRSLPKTILDAYNEELRIKSLDS